MRTDRVRFFIAMKKYGYLFLLKDRRKVAREVLEAASKLRPEDPEVRSLLEGWGRGEKP